MTADDYIKQLRKRQPKLFAAKTIQIKVESFETALRAAFQAGRSECIAEHTGTGNPFDAIFPGLNRN